MPRLVSVKLSLSEDARDVLDHFCTKQGVTLGACTEAFAEAVQLWSDDALPGHVISPELLVERARTIAAGRRRRQDPAP